ncbi:MAG: BolA/IbaG family iron-sulfur metabolism protein, partial [Methylobacterium sp.]|nr:BolA/IbaG family iron-sulfur metabolism protein [Methylobacterium sp.]
MLRAEQVKAFIMQGLACDYVAVYGEDGQHFEAVVVSPQFAGKRTVQQHQLVY